MDTDTSAPAKAPGGYVRVVTASGTTDLLLPTPFETWLKIVKADGYIVALIGGNPRVIPWDAISWLDFSPTPFPTMHGMVANMAPAGNA
jgi:hypothetical protein